MQSYWFCLRNGKGVLEEELGAMGFLNDEAAVGHIRRMIADLIREGAGEYAGWTLEAWKVDLLVSALKIA
jgi:hypothetical protein